MVTGESTGDQEISGIDHAIDQVFEHWQNLRAAQIASADADADAASSSSDDEDDTDSEEADAPGHLTRGQKSRKALLDSLTPAELAAAQKRALLAQYGYVQEDGYDAGGESGMGGSTLRKREEEKEAAERRALIDKAIREDGRRKRKSKRAKEQGKRVTGVHVRAGCADACDLRTARLTTKVDLMAPNLNKAKVQVKAQMARDSAKMEANFKKERDRAALEKQR